MEDKNYTVRIQKETMPIFLQKYIKNSTQLSIQVYLDECTGLIYTAESKEDHSSNSEIIKNTIMPVDSLPTQKNEAKENGVQKFESNDASLSTLDLTLITNKALNSLFVENDILVRNIKGFVDDFAEDLQIIQEETNEKNFFIFTYFLDDKANETETIKALKYKLVSSASLALISFSNTATQIAEECNYLRALPVIPLLNPQPIFINDNYHEYIRTLETTNAGYIKDYTNQIPVLIEHLNNLKYAFNTLENQGVDLLHKVNELISESESRKKSKEKDEMIQSSEWYYPFIYKIKIKMELYKKVCETLKKNITTFNEKIQSNIDLFYSNSNQTLLINQKTIDSANTCKKILFDFESSDLLTGKKSIESSAQTLNSDHRAQHDLSMLKDSIHPDFYEFISNKIKPKLNAIGNHSRDLGSDSDLSNQARLFQKTAEVDIDQPNLFKRNIKSLLIGAVIGLLVGLTLTMLVFSSSVAPALGLLFLAAKLTLPGFITLGIGGFSALGLSVAIIFKSIRGKKNNKVMNDDSSPISSLAHSTPRTNGSDSLDSYAHRSTKLIQASLDATLTDLVSPTTFSDNQFTYPTNLPHSTLTFFSSTVTSTQSSTTTPNHSALKSVDLPGLSPSITPTQSLPTTPKNKIFQIKS